MPSYFSSTINTPKKGTIQLKIISINNMHIKDLKRLKKWLKIWLSSFLHPIPPLAPKPEPSSKGALEEHVSRRFHIDATMYTLIILYLDFLSNKVLFHYKAIVCQFLKKEFCYFMELGIPNFLPPWQLCFFFPKGATIKRLDWKFNISISSQTCSSSFSCFAQLIFKMASTDSISNKLSNLEIFQLP